MKNPQTSVLLLCVLTSSVWVTAAQQRPGASGDAQKYLNRAADAILAVKSTRFSLKREGTPAYQDDKAGITIAAADCGYSAPDRGFCDIRVSLQNGTIIQ